MVPGAVIDLPAGLARFTVNVSWSSARVTAPEVDVVAFELGTDEKVPSDDEFVFFNQPASPDGSLSRCLCKNVTPDFLGSLSVSS